MSLEQGLRIPQPLGQFEVCLASVQGNSCELLVLSGTIPALRGCPVGFCVEEESQWQGWRGFSALNNPSHSELGWETPRAQTKAHSCRIKSGL